MNVSIRIAMTCLLCLTMSYVAASATQKLMARKQDKEWVTVTITGVDGSVIIQKRFKNNKQQLKLNWARGQNTINAVYKDGTTLPDLKVSGLQGSDSYVPQGSELLISKQGMSISLPAEAVSARL